MSRIGLSANPFVATELVRAALLEDFGRAGDITSAAIVPENQIAEAVFRARGEGVFAGMDLIAATFRLLDPGVQITRCLQDGDPVTKGDDIARVTGAARTILMGERVALNFASRLSGIATLTAQYAARVSHTKAAIVCTRKTTPGLRTVEKYAVRCGGGANHRFGLDDAFLIKDNHIAVAGSAATAFRLARQAAGPFVKIEIEVDRLEQLEEILDLGADIVMFDNMSPQLMRRGVDMVAGRMLTEASGGVNLASVAAIAESGVDIISVGALTHSASALDIGLDIDGM